ncbi:sensor histidine kinase [Nisaea nitritireducens]|uniref:sensor histidine kinase n=1 Tax=Nisaea nitritireducens TaxID=568392 RepID=UPI00186728FE|nr:HAMP domain-containing sensor histidine kinase [Nisaea nitritireducens]
MTRARALVDRRPLRTVPAREFAEGSRLSVRLVALSAILAFFAIAVNSVPSRGEDGAITPSILILNSWFPEQPWQAAVEKGIRDGLHEAGLKAQVYVEYLDAGRFPEKQVEDAHRKLFDIKFSGASLDLVISESLPAGRFLALNPDLFPGAARLYLRAGSVAPADASRVDYNANVEQAFAEMLRVADPRHIFVVADTTGAIGKTRVGAAEAAVARLEPDADVEYLVDLSMAEIQERVADLPPDSAIFFLPVFVDGAGERFIPYEAVRRIAASANAPVFSAWDTLLGSGIVGGRLLSGEAVGRVAAEHISAIIHGTVPVLTDRTNMRSIYDNRQLKKWNISTGRLPPNAEIRFADLSVWDQYRWIILSTIALIVLLSGFSVAMFILNRRLKHVTSLLEEERSQLEERVSERTNQLKESNEELQQFAHAISHDLNNPLGAAKGYISLLLHSVRDELGKDDVNLLTRAGIAIDKAIGMVGGLLEYSLATGGEKIHKPVSTASVLTDVQANLAQLVKDTGTRIDVEKLPPVVGNEIQLLRLFQNLIENAIKYRRQDVAPLIRVAGRRDDVDGHYVFTIEDNGLGMSEADQKRIFELFTRLESGNSQPGSGIGLAQCKKIVEKHGGSIKVSSVPGEGSTFSISLLAAAAS